MNERTSLLLNLIDLHEGRLPREQASRLRARVKQDQTLNHQWRKVRRCFQLAAGEAVVTGQDHHELPDPEAIACLIDGQAPAEKLARIEAEIWKSDQAISELINEVKFQRELALHSVPARLSRRIVDGLDGPIQTPVAEADPESLVIAVDENKQAAMHSKVARRSYAWLAALVALVLVMVSGWALYQADMVPFIARPGKLNDGQGKDRGGANPNSNSNDENADEPDSGTKQNRKKHQPDLVLKNKKDGKSKLDKNRTAKNNGTLPDSDKNPNSIDHDIDRTAITDQEMDAFEKWVNENQPNESPNAGQWVDVEWKQVKGLLAIENSQEEILVGYEYPREKKIADYYTTLPNSWVRGSIDKVADVVANASSSFKIVQPDDQKRLMIDVAFGQVAFQNLESEKQLHFSSGGKHWPIEILDDKTTVAIDASDSTNPRLIVQRGRAKFRQQEVSRGMQVKVLANSRYEIVENEISLNWVSRSPGGTVNLDTRSRKTFFQSGDLKSELQQTPIRLSGRQNPTLQIEWGMSLQPLNIREWVLHQDPEIQVAATRWLLNQRIDNAIGRKAWVGLARQTKQVAKVRQLYQWNASFKFDGKLPPRSILEKTIALLDDDDLIFRVLGYQVMADKFGAAHYDPRGPREGRIRATRLWKELILDVYKANRGSIQNAPRNQGQQKQRNPNQQNHRDFKRPRS